MLCLTDFYALHCDEIAFHFVSEKQICKLHDQFFNDPSPTDCITLPIDSPNAPGYIFLGDVFVCPKAALELTTKTGSDLYKEITLYAVHGLLHLLGYDDMNTKDKRKMRRAEAKAMDHLNKAKLFIQ